MKGFFFASQSGSCTVSMASRTAQEPHQDAEIKLKTRLYSKASPPAPCSDEAEGTNRRMSSTSVKKCAQRKLQLKKRLKSWSHGVTHRQPRFEKREKMKSEREAQNYLLPWRHSPPSTLFFSFLEILGSPFIFFHTTQHRCLFCNLSRKNKNFFTCQLLDIQILTENF